MDSAEAKVPPGDEAGSALVKKLRQFIPLTAEEVGYLHDLESEEARFDELAELVAEGEPYPSSYVVKDGWACHYKLLPDGRRQILNFALPGDFLGLHAYVFNSAPHSVQALTDLVVGKFAPERIIDMYQRFPRLGAACAWADAREAAILGEHLVSLGRRSAYERLAHLFMELRERLRLVEQARARSFELPVTQEALADLLGLSVVHINRTLQRLRKDGLVELDSGRNRLILPEPEELAESADFSDEYLHHERRPQVTEDRLRRHRMARSAPTKQNIKLVTKEDVPRSDPKSRL